MMRSFWLGLAGVLLMAAPALAAENCEQVLKDTRAAYKTNTIGPKALTEVDALVREAEDLCKQGNSERASELLRMARAMIGE
jgi:hypothetical protein